MTAGHECDTLHIADLTLMRRLAKIIKKQTDWAKNDVAMSGLSSITAGIYGQSRRA